MDENVERDVPLGWTRIPSNDPFQERNGPLFFNETADLAEGEHVRIGVRIAPDHCNFFGTCHGGMLATLVDVALGTNAGAASGAEITPTIGLSIDYLNAARTGDWLESRARVIRMTRRMVFCDVILHGPDGPVARANGTFKIQSPRS